MNLRKLRYGVAFCVLASLGSANAQTQLPDEYSAHVAAAKNAALFDWVRPCWPAIAWRPRPARRSAITATDPGHDVY